MRKLKIFLEMIKFEHTLFALPFAYIGALLTGLAIPQTYHLIWITLAMVGARTAAMSLNRIIDRRIDALNPRTANRALPKGLLNVSEVWLYVAVSLLLFGISAYKLSPLAFTLSPIALFALTFYSYTKRFTWLCHFFLGATLSMAPMGAWVAIANSLSLEALILGLGVMFWVAGFDIVYACDDYDFDKASGIFSIPARFGIAKALTIAAGLHVIAPVCFAAVGLLLGLGIFYWAGLLVAVFLLYYQHRLISPTDLSKAGVAFYGLNGTLSMVMFIFTLLDILFPSF
ncbi:MAG: putative 4-hydroxybenzoate polyprenyltransferase [Negativicutes bacterium]|nr:putative 4-hydroxybenzoate polyprenyltransferase [Negativicutes bacterium]